MNDDPFAPLRSMRGARDAIDAINKKPRWISVVPVPTDAPPPPPVHPTLGAPSAIWTYRDTTGTVLAYMHRFEPKTFRPLTLWRNADDKLRWRWESLPCKRSLYGLWRLAERPSAQVLVCDGQGSVDAATYLLPEFVAVTSPNGSKSASKADWSPLKGRAVTVWPDRDTAGLDYARQVAKLAAAAGARSVAIVSPPGNVKMGWDAADALADGWTTEQAIELLSGAVPADKILSDKTTAVVDDKKSEPGAEPPSRRRTT